MISTIGTVGYHAGTSGTVTLVAGEQVVSLIAVASGSSGTVQIDGGDTIPLVASVALELESSAYAPPWVGVAIVFANTASYFIKTVKPFA